MPGSWPMPAACISGVVPSTVGMNGSAPASSSARITGRSFALAAIANAVAPRMFPRWPFTWMWNPGVRAVWRSGSAPCSRNALTMRSRSAACSPPNGLHWLPSATPLERSFSSVSHFPAAQCSGEKPGPRFGSAPWSSRNSA